MAKPRTTQTVQGSLVVHGIMALLFGFAAVFWPGLTIVTLVYLFGAYILVSGVANVIHGITSIGDSDWWFLNTVLGIVEIGVGVYLLRHPFVTFKTFILLIGLSLILRGVIGLASALFNEVTNGVSRFLGLASSLIAIVTGIIVLYQKVAAGVAFVWVLGAYAILLGSMQLSAARKLGELK